MRNCECCRERRGRERRAVGGGFRARLCDLCAAGHHGPDFCRMCDDGALIWHCARLAHVQAVHPQLLEKLVNDDFQVAAEPLKQKYLGTLRYPLDERLN